MMLAEKTKNLSLYTEKNINSLHFAFENYVQKQPNATALIWQGRAISYSELDMAASFLASQITYAGVGVGSVVPILLSRSPNLVISLLAILKAGAAYTLIDPSWPEARIRQVIKALSTYLIITDNKLLSFNGLHILSPINQYHEMKKPYVSIEVDHLSPATIFFTSGTTGEPKGVISTHKGVMRLFKESNFASFTSTTVIPLAAALPWDAFSLELWGALINGGTAWIIEEPYLSAAALREGVDKYGINTVWLTSSLFNMIVEEDTNSFVGLKQVLIGGEKLSQTHVKTFLKSHAKIKLINGYGPVETTVFATTHEINLNDCEISSGIPIGIPVPETQVYVLDKEMAICNDGEVGQICIGGKGLALGYLNDPQLTNDKFKEVMLQGKTRRIYCTGDLGFWRDGRLHFQGRQDRQVKVHGHRIELPEVERQIEQYVKNIKSCRVISRNNRANSSQELIAFCIPVKVGDSLQGAHQLLKAKLVAYQCPTKVIAVASFPLTPQGKLDEKTLLEESLKKEALTHQARDEYKNPMEETIGKVLSLILNQAFFPVNVPFKQLGLNSLDMGRLCSRLGKELQRPISLSKLYQYPTIASLSNFLNDNAPSVDLQEHFKNQNDKMTPMQLMYLTQYLVNPSNLASRCLITWTIDGDLDLNILQKAMEDVHIKNTALRSKYLPDLDSDNLRESIYVPTLEVLASEQSIESAINKLRRELSKDLDPITGKIWRAGVIPITNSNTHLFGCAVHHIAFDGYSEHLFAASLSEGYNKFSSFPDFINSLDNHSLICPVLTPQPLGIDALGEIKNFAKDFEGASELSWPSSSENLSPNCSSSAELITLIARTQVEAIDKLAVQNALSRFEILFYAWIHALQEITGQTEFCIGIPVRQRDDYTSDDIISCHLNMLCLRITEKLFKNDFSGLQETSALIQNSLANQDIPIAEVFQLIKPQKKGRAPIFQTLFALQDNPLPKLNFRGLKTEFIRQPYLDLPLELHSEIWPQKDKTFRFVISYRLDCISTALVKKLSKSFKQHLERILNYSQASIGTSK